MALLTATGLLAATLTVVITTIEDCVWLVPFVAQAPSLRVGIIHALIFCFTFEAVALAACLLTLVLGESLEERLSLGDLALAIIGASLCWVLTGYLYCRSWKRRREREERVEPTEACDKRDYGATEEGQRLTADSDDTVERNWEELPTSSDAPKPKVWIIVSLTILGSLDEMSYFPALILGGIFTVAELCLATFFASCVMLIVVIFFLAQCQGFLDILDWIPLYGVVAIFAILLTIEAIWELVTDGD